MSSIAKQAIASAKEQSQVELLNKSLTEIFSLPDASLADLQELLDAFKSVTESVSLMELRSAFHPRARGNSNHPARAVILDALKKGPLTTNEVKKLLASRNLKGESGGYHLKQLTEAQLVGPVGRNPIRWAIRK